MGQHQSALGGNPGENNQPEGSAAAKTNQDLLWDIFNNNALLEQQISSNRYTASSSAAAEAEDPSSQFRLRQDYFDEDTEKSHRANEKYYHGSTKWWSALLSRPLFEAQEGPAQTQAQGERQLARELAQTIAVMREETGTAQVLKDSSFDKRTGFLMHFYKELADKAADCSESTKAFISMTVAEERAAAAEGSKTQGTIPPGIRLSIRTTMQIVLAMLNDSTRNNPALCAHILDILINALTETPALCLHKDDIPSTSPYVQVISDGVAEVSKFLAVTVGTFKGNTPEETHLIKTKAIEALLALNIASGSFESSVMLVKLLLSLHEEENQESTSSHFYSLRCPQSLVHLLQTLEEPILAALPKGIQHAVSSVAQQTEQQQVRPWQLLSFFLCQLFSVCVLEEEERQAKDSAAALSLPFIMNISKESFQTLYTISTSCRNLSKQQKSQQEQTDQSSIYDFALLLIFKMLKVHFRHLSLARIQPKDVGLAWPETPSRMEEEDEESKVLVDKISSLLRYYIFQAQGESDTEKQIQLEACQTLAYALDYVVPNQSEQLNLLVNALQEVNAKQEKKKASASSSSSLPVGDSTSSSSSYSGAYFLEKMLAQLSDAAAVNRLFKPSETKDETEQAEKTKEKDEDNVQPILPLIFSYSKHQLERSLEQQLSSPSSKKEGEEARPGYVRFLLTLQNYIFASLAEQQPQQSKTEAGEEKEIESEEQKAKLEQRKQQQYYLRQYYTLQAMNHFQEQLESVRSVVLHHNAQSGKEATAGLGAQKTEQLLRFLTRSSTFALLPALASSFMLDLSHSSASSSSSYPDLTRELMTKVLAFLRNVESLQSELAVGSASGSSASASSYGLTIVETLHSYANNMDICKHVAVSDASGLTLEFDENSRTEETHDWLKLFLAPNNCNQFQEQLTGGTHKWPKHPLHVPSNAVWFMFHSDASNVDWGFRCKVKYTIKNRFWLPELERTLLWIVVKIAMKMMGSYTDKELRYLPWLNSNLLKAGMSQQSIYEEESKGKAVSSTAEEETEFLRDLIELRGDAGRMHKKFIPSHLSSSASQLAGITSKSVDRAVRVVVAAILHHAHLTPDAIKFANEGSSSNPSPALKRAYRYGYKVKKWFIQQRQKEANQGSESDSRSVYDRLAEKVSQKAECLLRFTPVLSREQHLEKTGALKSQQQQRSVSLRRSVDRLIVQAGGQVPSTLASIDDDSNDDVSSVLGGGSLLALAEGPGAPSWYWEPAARAILSFVQSEEVNAEDVEECVRLRKQRANDRAECLALFADIVTSLKSCSSPALLQEVMALVGWALKSYAPLNDGGGKKEQRDKNLEKVLKARTKGLHHYSHDLQCAGAELQQKVSDAFYPLYKTLLSLLDSRATDASTSVMQASAFVCDCLALKFHTENDFEFLLESDIFQKILPLVLEVPSTSTASSSLASSSSSTSSSDTGKGKEKQESAQEQQREGESSSSSEEQQKPKLKARRIIIASKDDMESEGQQEGWIDVEDEEDIRFLMGGTDDTESKAKQERFIALYKKRQAAWLLLQTIALQCIHPSSKANSNKSGTTTTHLYPAQLKLTQQLLDLLHEHLNNSWKENTTLFTGENGPRRVSFFGKGLGKRPKQTKLFRLSEDWSKDIDQTALSPADIGLLLFSLASASAVVRAELCTPKWMCLLMTFLKEENEEVPPLLVPEEAKEAEKAKEKEKEEEQETEEKKEEKKRKREIRRLLKIYNGTKSFMKVLVTHLFSITLPQVDPNNINNNANNECNQLAKQIADELLSGIGQGLGVASFLSIAVAKPAQEGEDEEAALEKELQHVNRLPALSTAASNMLQALQRLLKSSEHWKTYITTWVMQRLQSALPKVLPALLLSGEPQQQAQLSALIQESVTALSLMGKRGVHFTPGTRVDPQEPVFHGKSSILSVRDYTELYLHVGNDTTQTWTQPKDLKLMPEKTDVTAEFLSCAKQMLSLLPLFTASIPSQQEEDAKLLLAASSADEPENINYRTLYHPRCKDLLSSIAYAELQRLYFRTLSMFVQHADVRQALLQDQGLLQALLHIVLEQNKEDGALTLTAQETLLGELELECSARGAVYAKAKRDKAALATSLQRLNFPLQKCNSVLEATGYDVLESYRTLLKEKLLQPKGKNPTKDSLPLSLENYIWSPATHSQLDDVSIRLIDDPSKTTTSALSMLFDPADASRPPIWFEILQMMHRISSHYALDSLIRLILHFPALSPSSAASLVSSSSSSKKGKEKEGGEEQSESLYTSLWSLLRQPSTLATFTKRVLGVRLNKESYQPIDVMQALTVLTRWSEKETLDKAMVLSAPPSKPTPSSSSMKEKEEEKNKPSAEATLARLVAEMTSFLSTTPKHLASIKVHLEESEHPYPNEADYEKTIKLDGAERLIIIFDKETLTENNYDWLRFYQPDTRELIHQFSGPFTQFKNFAVSGNRLLMKFTSDATNNYWGYKFYVFGVTSQTSDEVTKALNLLELILRVSEGDNAAEVYSPAVYTAENLRLLTKAVSNSLDAATRTRIIHAIRHLIHPHLLKHYNTKPDLMELISTVQKSVVALYAQQKDDPVYSKSLQALIDLLLLAYNSLDVSEYDPLDWLLVGTHSQLSSIDWTNKQQIAELRRESDWEKRKWKAVRGLNGCISAAAFSSRTSIAKLHDNKPIALVTAAATKTNEKEKEKEKEKEGEEGAQATVEPDLSQTQDGWTVCGWFLLPLCETTGKNTLIQFDNGDQIVSTMEIEEGSELFGSTLTSKNISLAVWEASSETYHPIANLPVRKHEPAEESSFYDYESSWHFIAIRAVAGGPVRGYTAQTLKTESSDPLSSTYNPSASIIAIGNGVGLGEQFGAIDQLHIVTDKALSSAELQKINQKGLVNLYRKGSITPLEIAASNTYVGSIAISAKDGGIVGASKDVATVVAPVVVTKGKWYYEVKLVSNPKGLRIGWASADAAPSTLLGSESSTFGWDPQELIKYSEGNSDSYGRACTAGDVIGIKLDLDARVVEFYLNGTSLGVAFSAFSEMAMCPAFSLKQSNEPQMTVHFNQSELKHLPVDVLPLGSSEVLLSAVHRPVPHKPKWLRRALDTRDLLVALLLRKPFPRSFMEQSLHDKEFLMFYAGDESNDVAYQTYLELANNTNPNWTLAMDEQLIEMVNRICSAKDYDPMDISPDVLTMDESLSYQFPALANADFPLMIARFHLLRTLNKRITRLVPFLDCSRLHSATVPAEIFLHHLIPTVSNASGEGSSSSSSTSSSASSSSSSRAREEGAFPTDGTSLPGLAQRLRGLMLLLVKRKGLTELCSRNNTSKETQTFKFNRLKAAKFASDSRNGALHTLFGQFYTQLAGLSDVNKLRQSDRAWRVEFIGEGATDQGGPYRESLAQMASELYGEALPLFVKTPNQRHHVGADRDKYTLNPTQTSEQALGMYRALGVIMGICIRTRNVFDLRLPSFVWKLYLGEEPTIKDLEGMDVITAQLLHVIETQLTDEEMFDLTFDDLTFVTTLSDGTEVELKEGGRNQRVTWENRLEFTRLVRECRLNECRKQAEAMRLGTSLMVSFPFLKLFTWSEIESLVCGKSDYDVDWLMARTAYRGTLSSSSPVVEKLWEVLREFAPEERAKFMRFVYGQARLPPSVGGSSAEFSIENFERGGCTADDLLPEAQTCSFKLKLPAYSTKERLKAKLLFAINNCAEIDSDFTPSQSWAPSDMQPATEEEHPSAEAEPMEVQAVQSYADDDYFEPVPMEYFEEVGRTREP